MQFTMKAEEKTFFRVITEEIQKPIDPLLPHPPEDSGVQIPGAKPEVGGDVPLDLFAGRPGSRQSAPAPGSIL